MYLYSFDRFFGFDKVCILAENSNKKKVKAGDLLIFGNQYFLALGETLAFPEQYTHLTSTQAEIVYKEFLSLPALQLFHRMVETYYTTYKSVVRLFFADDIEKLLEREKKSVKSKVSKVESHWKFSLAQDGQTLVVFPDLWTMFNTTDEAFRADPDVAFLSAIQTQNQKDIRWREIKKWMKSVIICTYAEIFQDFHDLKKIIFIDPHKRYYAHQQDPRYKVADVVEKIKKLYGAEVEILGV